MNDIKIQSQEIELVSINTPIPYEKNMNQHTDEQIERLVKLIEYQGFRNPLVLQKGTNRIATGHGRLMAAKKMQMSEVPVIYQEFESEEQFYAYVVSDNAIQEWADLDLGKINQDFLDLGPDLDIDMLGLKDFVLEPIEKFEPQGDEDSVPELKEDPITKRGDVWLLGKHRLMCGDSTMIDDVEKLMNGETMELVHTDPPYGINEKCDRAFASPTREAKGNSFHQIKNDDSVDAAVDAYNLCEALNIPRQVWWGANYYAHSIPQTNNWLVWDKRVEEKQRDMNSDCELAYVKSKWSSVRIFRHLWKGMIKDSEHGQARVHPTQKPVALIEWVFEYYKDDLTNVIDLFCGSGSTLIACENKNKKCFGMELDEIYADVIINRYMKFTGRDDVTLESTGEKYIDLKAAHNV